jgi:hypothetical protein
VGGDELNPGNESQDRVLVAAAGGGPAYVLATAAGRQHPEASVRHATAWFARLGLDVEELPAIGRRDTNSASNASKAATSTIPIVFAYGGDPVSDGFVASMNRPSGNVTGLTALTTELAGKRLDLLHKLVPNVETIGFLSGPKSYVGYPVQTAGILAAGRGLGRLVRSGGPRAQATSGGVVGSPRCRRIVFTEAETYCSVSDS